MPLCHPYINLNPCRVRALLSRQRCSPTTQTSRWCRALSSTVKRTRLKRSIRTLDPRRLQPSDFVDLSGIPSVRTNTVVLASHDAETQTTPFHASYHNTHTLPHVPYPAGTHGFWYYHRPPEVPPAAGEVRFRITASRDPAQFSNGSDLNAPTGLPWSIPVAATNLARWTALRDLLVNDGQVDVSLLARLAQSAGPAVDAGTTIVHTVGQVFFVDLSATRLRMRVAHGEDLHTVHITALFSRQIEKVFVSPFTGGAHMRFERIITDNEPALALRTVKLLDFAVRAVPQPWPVKGMIPQEGALLIRYLQGGWKTRIWLHTASREKAETRALSYLLEH